MRTYGICAGLVFVAMFVPLFSGSPLHAAPIVIDFEQFVGMPNNGEPIPQESRLYDQLLSTHGVLFTSGSPYVAVVSYYRCVPSGTHYLAGSTPYGWLTFSRDYPITICFVDPSDASRPATTDYVSVTADLCGISSQEITLKAFDIHGDLVGECTKPDSGGTKMEVFVSGDRRIHSVKFFGSPGDDNGVAIDDLTFNPLTIEDTTPPEITIVAPEPYGLYSVGSLVLDFSAYDLVSGQILPPDLMGTLSDATQGSQDAEPGCIPPIGVYSLTVTAVDEAGNYADPESVMFVVYDPEGGFVTGGGWIDSPAGAYRPDTSLSGKAHFGFVSKYKAGAATPTGETEFVFQAGDLNFHSGSYEWLVVTGSNYARFKGVGTINGHGSYMFMLWAGDSPDTFRIRIWTEDDAEMETDVYDNGMNQPIGGGSIVIHAN